MPLTNNSFRGRSRQKQCHVDMLRISYFVYCTALIQTDEFTDTYIFGEVSRFSPQRSLQTPEPHVMGLQQERGMQFHHSHMANVFPSL